MVETYAALQHQVFDQTSHRVVRERRNHRRLHPERPAQAPRHVIFPAAFPHAKLARSMDADVAGIEAQHDFTEAHQIPAAPFFGANLHAGSFCSEKPAAGEGDRVARGSTKSQATAPRAATAAATRKPACQPNCAARSGVSETVIMPPI